MAACPHLIYVCLPLSSLLLFLLLILFLLPPPGPADKTMHTDSLVISKNPPPPPKFRLHNTRNQIQIQLLLLLMPTKIVPTPKGVNQLRTLSHSEQSNKIFIFCFSSLNSKIKIALFSLATKLLSPANFVPFSAAT